MRRGGGNEKWPYKSIIWFLCDTHSKNHSLHKMLYYTLLDPWRNKVLFFLFQIGLRKMIAVLYTFATNHAIQKPATPFKNWFLKNGFYMNDLTCSCDDVAVTPLKRKKLLSSSLSNNTRAVAVSVSRVISRRIVVWRRAMMMMIWCKWIRKL